jgi:hypothetical protein
MSSSADIVEKTVEILLPEETGIDVPGKSILIFEQQGDGDGDFKPIFPEECEKLEGSSLSRTKSRHCDVGIEDDPPLPHGGIVGDTER